MWMQDLLTGRADWTQFPVTASQISLLSLLGLLVITLACCVIIHHVGGLWFASLLFYYCHLNWFLVLMIISHGAWGLFIVWSNFLRMNSQQLEHQSKGGISVSGFVFLAVVFWFCLSPCLQPPAHSLLGRVKLSKIKKLCFLGSFLSPRTASISSRFLFCLLWRLCSHLRVGAVKLVGHTGFTYFRLANGKFFLLSPPESFLIFEDISFRKAVFQGYPALLKFGELARGVYLCPLGRF